MRQVASDQNISFDEKPEMKCHEITDLAIKALQSGKYRHVRCNFPNPDMVGHTGNLDATIEACSAVDKCIKVSNLVAAPLTIGIAMAPAKSMQLLIMPPLATIAQLP